MGLEIIVTPTGLLDVNTVIIFDSEINDAVIIDPGGSEDYLHKFLTERNLSVNSIIHTHAHFDHISGTSGLLEKYPGYKNGVKIYLHHGDQPLWEHPEKQGSMFGLQLPRQSTKITNWLEPDSVLNFQGFEMKVLHTPGHSPGSCSFYIANKKTLISGDVIFQGSIGRTDLWLGDFDTLIKSINEKIFVLPDDTRIISGHGPATTVGEEKISNPFLRA
jgi:glyoxylase-like metal-dependent hydrolase (beta-lactamase superfamily II)